MANGLIKFDSPGMEQAGSTDLCEPHAGLHTRFLR